MTSDAPDSLETLIRHAGEGWLIDWYSPKQDAMPHLHEKLHAADAHMHERFPGTPDTISEAALLEEYRRSPHKARAFLQAAGESESPDMLIMAWRLLRGMEVAQVDMHYQMQERFALRITLKGEGHDPEIYESTDIDDAAVFRHFGILKMDDRPVFDGFYALQR